MPTLSEKLLAEPHCQALVEDLAIMLEAHVASIKGLRGVGLRTGLSMLRAARPNALSEAVKRLLPESLEHLEPEYQNWLAGGSKGGFDAFLTRDPRQLGERLMGVVDARVDASSNSTLRSMYPKLRGSIASEVNAVAPRLAAILVRHLDK